jgi:hypothetical protein
VRRSLAITSASFLAVGLLAGCSSSDDSSSEGEMVGGMTECTDEIVNQAAEEYVNEMSGGENAWYPDSVQCADGWAVASGINGEANAPEDGPLGAPTNIIFQAEGQFWVPKDAADVCGTIDGDTYPSDAEIPEALFPACLSG